MDEESKEMIELSSGNLDSLLRLQNDIKNQDLRVEKITKFASLQESNCSKLQEQVDKLVPQYEGSKKEVSSLKNKVKEFEGNLHECDNMIRDLN